MDKDEEATEYLTVLLGFRGAFRNFYDAAEIFAEKKSLRHDAVAGTPRVGGIYGEQPFCDL